MTIVVRGSGARRVEDVDRINLSLAVVYIIDEDNENILIIDERGRRINSRLSSSLILQTYLLS